MSDPPPLAPMTYSGLLDDAGIAYAPSAVSTAGEDFFRRTIAKNVFFSGGIYLNDGYLVNHPAARRELGRDDSLLRIMMRTQNFVRVLSRSGAGDDLASMPVRMAESGSASFRTLVASDEWPALRTTLRRLAGPLSRGNIRAWPGRVLQVGFVKLIDRALAAPPAAIGLSAAAAIDLPALHASFHGRGPLEANARQHFEDAARAAVGQAIDAGRLAKGQFNAAMHELMTIANQAYHYNFGMCLNEGAAEPVGVDTSIGPAFDELLALDEVYEGALDDIRVFRLPKSLPFSNGRLFDDIIDAATRIGEAKMRYLSALETLFRMSRQSEAARIAAARAEFGEASGEYRRRIAEHFGSLSRDDTEELVAGSTISVGFGKLAGSIGAAVAAGPAIGLVVDLLAGLITDKYKPGEFLLRKVRTRELDTDMREDIPPLIPGRHYEFTAREIVARPRYSSVGFSPLKVEEHLRDVPRFTAPPAS